MFRNIDSSRLGLYLGVACLAAAALLTGCGGGGSSPTEQASSYTEGVITGFGSIIVNGVRFDDSAATVSDDDGTPDRGRGDLQLGMVVQIDGTGVDRTAGTGVATRIRFGSEIVGPVASVGTNSLVVLGQTIDIRPTTVWDDSLPRGLADIAVGEVIEVHALFDAATGRYSATLIEDKASAQYFKLRGQVSALNTGAKTFQLGSEVVYYGNVPAGELTPKLADGQRVRVRLQTARNGAGQWVATRVESGVRRVEDHDDSDIHGLVDSLTDARHFTVNGVAVDASGAVFEDGPVALGARVEVEGRVANGVLVARKVELEDRSSNDRGEIELHGSVASVDAAAQTFVLRHAVHGDRAVSYSGDVRFEDGSAAQLAAGTRVEVKGYLTTGGVLQAVRIKFED
jgi:hypothetical protein